MSSIISQFSTLLMTNPPYGLYNPINWDGSKLIDNINNHNALSINAANMKLNDGPGLKPTTIIPYISGAKTSGLFWPRDHWVINLLYALYHVMESILPLAIEKILFTTRPVHFIMDIIMVKQVTYNTASQRLSVISKLIQILGWFAVPKRPQQMILRKMFL
jgi:hypothetical protein